MGVVGERLQNEFVRLQEEGHRVAALYQHIHQLEEQYRQADALLNDDVDMKHKSPIDEEYSRQMNLLEDVPKSDAESVIIGESMRRMMSIRMRILIGKNSN